MDFMDHSPRDKSMYVHLINICLDMFMSASHKHIEQLSPMLSSKKTNNRSQRPDFLLTSSKKLEGKRQSTLATDDTDSFLSSNGQSQNIRASWSTKSHRKKAVHFKKTAAYLVHVESKENLGRGVIKGGK